MARPSDSKQGEARRRFRGLLLLMLGTSIVVLAIAFTWLHQTGTPLPLHFILAISLAVIGSLMLSALLMGLVFFSHSAGADDAPEAEQRAQRK